MKKTENINVVAEQIQQASVANGSEKAVTVGHAQSNLNVEKTTNRSVSAESPKEKLENEKDDANVTPIKTKPTNVEPSVNKEDINKEKIKQSAPPETEKSAEAEVSASAEIKENAAEKNKAEETPIQAQASINENSAENASRENMSLPKIDDEGAFPIVHIEENPKKGFSMMLLGLVIGMFVASIAMMAIAWMLFSGKGNLQQFNQQDVNQPPIQETESRELKALQKERDAVVAVNRALELERDAAIKAAEAQEKIRAAELRAAEILAEQEREAERKLQQAKIRIKEAERAEARARARERKVKSQVEKKTAEIEAQRLKALRDERKKLEAIAAEAKLAEQRRLQRLQAEQKAADERAAAQAAAAQSKVKEKSAEKARGSFSTNPCNTPSAKFLSTCKK